MGITGDGVAGYAGVLLTATALVIAGAGLYVRMVVRLAIAEFKLTVEKLIKSLEANYVKVSEFEKLEEYARATRHEIARDLTSRLSANHIELRDEIYKIRTEVAILKSARSSQ